MSTTTVPEKRRAPLGSVLAAIDRPVLVLAALALIGLWAALYRMASGLGGATSLSDGIPWGIWIGFDFSLIALSAAGFTMAGVVYVLRREDLRPALRPAVLTALLGYTAVLALLVLDLGRPDRFYHFLIFWNAHSPLFEISWCVLLYTTVLAIEVSPQVFERLHMERPVRIVHHIIVPVAIIAVTLSSLHQSTLGTLYLDMPYRLHPLWFTPILPLLFFTSSVMTGLAMAILGYEVAEPRLSRQRSDVTVLSKLALAAGWMAVVYLALKAGDLLLAGALPALLTFDGMAVRMWGDLALIVLPIVLLLTPFLRGNPRALWAGVSLILLGTVLNRFNATIFAQKAAVDATYTPHILEWLTTIGIVSAAMLAWLLGIRLLAVFERPHD